MKDFYAYSLASAVNAGLAVHESITGAGDAALLSTAVAVFVGFEALREVSIEIANRIHAREPRTPDSTLNTNGKEFLRPEM